jgi:chorismate mutase/prephenate dehydratase
MLKLLSERTKLSEKIGQVKKKAGQPVFDPAREEALLQELEKSNSGKISNRALRAIYYELFSASRAKQKRLRIGYILDPDREGYIAARDRFGAHEEFRPFQTATLALEAVTAGQVEVAVVPAAKISVFQSAAWAKRGVGISGEIWSHRTKKATRNGGFIFYLVTKIKKL